MRFTQYILILVVSACWGIHPSISKTAMTLLPNSYFIIFIQNILITSSIIMYRCIKPIPNLFNPQHTQAALSGSILNYGIALPVMTMATSHILITHMLLLIGLAPLFTYIIALLIKQSTPSTQKLLGSMVTFIALGILFISEIFTNTEINQWYAIILLTPLAFALQNNIIKSWARYELEVIGLVFYQNLFSSIFIAIFLFLSGSSIVTSDWFNLSFIMTVFFLACLHLFGQLFFYSLLKIANIVFSSQASNLSILVGVLWAILIGHEPITTAFFISMLTMLYGIYLTQK